MFSAFITLFFFKCEKCEVYDVELISGHLDYLIIQI